jgi:glutamine synthetase
MGKQEDFVLRALEERDVRFVRLWFTDVLGYLKSVAIAPAELEGALSEGIGFDGSAIEGFARVYEADMLAKPDPSTFQILPWRSEGPSTARIFCDIVMPDGSPSYADPRFVLKRTLSQAAENGFTFYTHPEIEFYLFQDAPHPVWSRCRSTAAGTSTTRRRAWARTSDARRSPCSRRWGSPWSSRTTRAVPGSRRSTCATPTRCPPRTTS